MNIWGITDVGVVRKQNQDNYHIELLAEDMALGIVCDGMGGAKAGNVASQLAVETFLDTANAQPPEQWRNEPEALLHFAAEQANGAVHFRASVDADCRGMGTTMVVALAIGNQAYILNIGDSRCYLVRPEGISRVTRDHSVVEDLVARGQITPEQARQHPQKNLITRALGAESQLRADLFRQSVEPGDALLLCSDGLSNVVSDQELLYEVLHGGPAEDCCRRLLDIALSRGAPDNVTAVLLQM
ncbi:Stp1/IreP family PP2C-type Ser/Thr phosphatase [Intestinimonas butyriciproducens]|uniref:Stp1/IreP family PP2C-type Ser/Thr phosphatase n=1 Tax=Candidatus Intestinimonas merdavium TaxID=2838622 RepID=A0A9D1Z2J9_9FIRM|nr:Stp1/IreP family PP2C-type Ser/Thr phosphatase [Intestinimonas butyriciproducens]MBM6974811.1 Stp1/IreP family PP2C-type Ser/Thr phosphatase [Intestinimonas butyriciproducens]HIY72834.1 Stp1/IreP family PP2C-type Ser/Thr phosphatase [Candidatus Intestinimonas merdavium]